MRKLFILFVATTMAFGCSTNTKKETKQKIEMEENTTIKEKADEFVSFKLTTDLNELSEKEKQMLPLLLDAAKLMEQIYWQEAYGDKEELFDQDWDEYTKKFLHINYGPWERLNDNKPYLPGYKAKPAGANFYPGDITKEEFEAWGEDSKTSLYTLIRRGEDGSLKSIPYHIAFENEIKQAADLLLQAAELAEDAGLKKYLEERSKALLTDDYFASDVAWMEMKNNTIEFIIGPIENYEDQLFGYKAAHESFILVKDKEWSKRLEKYAALLPGLQKALPCEQAYKDETPGVDSDMNVYDAIYYAGDCNAGSKTIAINLPNDEEVRETKGSRKLQLKNSMQAKFDKILVPIADLLIAEDQRQHVKFDAFFENTMFHEVAHGLGLGNTVDQNTTVREALKDAYTSIEEGKADILGLWCVYQLNEMGELGEKDMMDNFITFMAGIFRSVRFGAASAHGKANMMRFYYFQEMGAFTRDETTGTYRVDYEKMKDAMMNLSEIILKIQGDGDYETAKQIIEEKGFIREALQRDLDRIGESGIPRDIVFEQGAEVLGL
ncbi:Zn-dependent hydrolase [Draconibacterium sp. IB214405]|uniref:dipeptidyl-peptidase 3 family protein n=1 Tax=Draconibacterium sp. IB214405 TaxID=3097352 RepID=UPI002A147B04|nr:Zn-dependent hydrolase [Draconibacterium sp. IB214405]MDX8339664.1 Zn-dependent hydrolase [Draconibacterium sp. IB214405]